MTLDRATASRRLKAARWLAAERRNGRDQLIAMPADEIAALPEMRANKITASRIEEIEQERTTARPVELRQIAQALGLPSEWFDDDADFTALSGTAPVDQIAGLIDQHDQRMREQFDEIVARRDLTLERVVSRLSELSATAQTLQANLTEALERLDRQAVSMAAQGLLRPGDAGSATGTGGS